MGDEKMDEYKVVKVTLSDKSIAHNVVGNGMTFAAINHHHAKRLCKELNRTAWTEVG